MKDQFERFERLFHHLLARFNDEYQRARMGIIKPSSEDWEWIKETAAVLCEAEGTRHDEIRMQTPDELDGEQFQILDKLNANDHKDIFFTGLKTINGEVYETYRGSSGRARLFHEACLSMGSKSSLHFGPFRD